MILLAATAAGANGPYFTQVAGPPGAAKYGSGNSAVWLDYDKDGDLDLYANGGRYGSNSFFRNNDDGTFADETAASDLSNTDDSHHTAIGDFNNDGFPDIYEVNFTGYRSSKDKLLQNNLPEPATLALLALAGPVLIRRRRRRSGSA